MQTTSRLLDHFNVIKPILTDGNITAIATSDRRKEWVAIRMELLELRTTNNKVIDLQKYKMELSALTVSTERLLNEFWEKYKHGSSSNYKLSEIENWLYSKDNLILIEKNDLEGDYSVSQNFLDHLAGWINERAGFLYSITDAVFMLASNGKEHYNGHADKAEADDKKFGITTLTAWEFFYRRKNNELSGWVADFDPEKEDDKEDAWKRWANLLGITEGSISTVRSEISTITNDKTRLGYTKKTRKNLRALKNIFEVSPGTARSLAQVDKELEGLGE